MKIDRITGRLIGMILLFGSSMTTFAQDTISTKSTVTEVLTNEEGLWYMQPWVWVVGGVAVLLLLIAMFSGGRKKKDNATTRTDKVIITKTVRTETDVED